MTTFLEHVAAHILAKHGTDLSRLAVVFPNKRASLFLNNALVRQAAKPVWSPAYTTISELFRQHTTLQVADPIKLVCDLHRTFTAVTGFDETLDHFYGWGQLLLTDFDDIDKHLAPASQVFANLRDLREMDDVSYLTEEQRAAIRKFFVNFTDDYNTQLKERFLRLWSHVGDVYQRYHDRLLSQQLAYEGMLYRHVAEASDTVFDREAYLFVGFNLLHPVEQQLFKQLQRQQKAFFYWDFDHAYINAEAGHFMRQNLQMFPNELDSSCNDIYRCFSRPKTISFVSASTENIQARYASQWLLQLHRHRQQEQEQEHQTPDTAIVLCDEQLLPTIIHSLPEEAGNVNITTGYPLQLSPVATLIQQLLMLQTTGYDRQRNHYRLRQVNAVLKHPYITYLTDDYNDLFKQLNEQHIYYPTPSQLSRDEALTLLFSTPCTDNLSLLLWLADVVSLTARRYRAAQTEAGAAANPLTTEALFRAYTLLNRLVVLTRSGDLQVDIITLSRLMTQLIQQTTIPCHGEPAVGLQVMGVLETRNLDFSHLLVLSTGEGNMPKGTSESSFIPYSIRKAFGLTTAENKVAIYAYYFHRLLSRADHVTLVYNNATSDGQTGEMSRFMLQLLVESPHPVHQLTLRAAQYITPQRPQAKEKTPAVVEALKHRFSLPPGVPPDSSPLLTPTAINRYMRCPLQFYYHYVENLREPDETDDDTIDNRIFGNIFHEAACLIYEKMREQSPLIQSKTIDEYLKEHATIERCVDEAIRRELFHLSPSQLFAGHSANTTEAAALPGLNGLQIINRQVIIHYLRTLLETDRQLAPLTILGLETDVVEPFTVGSIGITTTVGGRIDRLDMIGEPGHPCQVRVLDYKTGSRQPKSFKTVDDIFASTQASDHADYFLQAMLYARIVSRRQSPGLSQLLPVDSAVVPALLFIQHATSDGYNPVLRLGGKPVVSMDGADADRFWALLQEKVEEIFHPDISFQPTCQAKTCLSCPYLSFCGR